MVGVLLSAILGLSPTLIGPFRPAAAPSRVGHVTLLDSSFAETVPLVLGLAGLLAKDEHRGPPPPCMDVLLAVCEAAHPCLLSPMQRIIDERRVRLQDASSSTHPRSLFLAGNPPGCVNCLIGEATVAGFDHCPHPLLCVTCANAGGFRTRGSRQMALMHCRLCRSAGPVDSV